MKFISVFFILIFSHYVQAANCLPVAGTSLMAQIKDLQVINLKTFQESKVQTWGPNCWNAALIGSGIVRVPRHVSKPEMWFWLNSKQCQKLKSDETPQLGDIGSEFSNECAGHFHSFLYLDKDNVFSKENSGESTGYKVQTLAEMINQYKDCNPADFLYHRCEPIPDDFYSKYKEFRDVNNEVIAIENKLAQWMENKSSVSDEEVGNLFSKLSKHFKQIRSASYKGEKEFVRKAFEYRLMGLMITDISHVEEHFNDTDYILSREVRDVRREVYNIISNERKHVPKTFAEASRF